MFFHRGVTFVALQRFTEAIKNFTKAVDRYEDIGTTDKERIYRYRFNLGVALRRVGELELSVIELKRATEELPQKAACWNNLGLSYFQNDQWEEATTAFQKAIQFEEVELKELRTSSTDNLSFYYNNRGLAHHHSRCYDDALKDLDEAVRLNDASAENFFNRGNAHMAQEDFDQAHQDFDKAIELDPSSAKLHHAKGLAY